MKIKIKKVIKEGYGEPKLPEYITPQSAGMDIYAANLKPIVIEPLSSAIIPTGIAIELPEGYEAQIRPRSGLALKHGITILNSPGTIDPDYRGEIKVILLNISKEAFIVNYLDRIAQMIISRCERVEWAEVATLSETSRGDGGFGHTGK
ncbi:MAG: dUTP diphosphatase [Deltaproteobacteria bacterium]|nr:dUTP diphosphatase [Deltaproteobacteria bacterium]